MNPTLSGIVALGMFALGTVTVALCVRIPAFELAAMSLFLGALGMSLYQYVRKQPILEYWRQPLSHYAFLISGVGGYTVLLFVAFQYAPAFEVNAINYMWPILLVLFAAIFHTGSLNALKVVGIIIGFLGTFLIFVPSQAGGFIAQLKSGHAIVLAAAVLWAAYSAMAKGKTYPAGLMAPAMFITAFICTFLHFWLEDTVMPIGFEWLYIFVLGFFRLSYLLWDEAMRGGDITLLASLAYFVPLASMLTFIAVGFTAANIWVAFGAGAIVCGCLVVNGDKVVRLLKP